MLVSVLDFHTGLIVSAGIIHLQQLIRLKHTATKTNARIPDKNGKKKSSDEVFSLFYTRDPNGIIIN